MTLPTITPAELKADITAVEQVIAVIEKYDSLLSIPAAVKTGIAELDTLLKWAETVV